MIPTDALYPQIDSVVAMERIKSYIVETPLRESKWLSEAGGARVFLKLDNLQTTGSFKFRGAANKFLSLTSAQKAAGVVTASNGNHALGISTMGQRLNVDVEVFVASTIDPSRKARIEKLGARVQPIGGGPLAAEQAARAEAARTGRFYASPYNDPDVMAGQGTLAVELLRHLPKVDAVFVTAGCGGLIGGVGHHLKSVSSAIDVVGCWPENSPVLYECLRAGRIIDVPEKETYSDSTTGNIEPGSITFPVAQKVIGTKVLVTEEAILDACRRLYRDEKQLVEGAAGVSVAAYLKVASQFRGKTVVIVLCGGNVDPALARLITQE